MKIHTNAERIKFKTAEIIGITHCHHPQPTPVPISAPLVMAATRLASATCHVYLFACTVDHEIVVFIFSLYAKQCICVTNNSEKQLVSIPPHRTVDRFSLFDCSLNNKSFPFVGHNPLLSMHSNKFIISIQRRIFSCFAYESL